MNRFLLFDGRRIIAQKLCNVESCFRYAYPPLAARDEAPDVS